MQQSQPVAIGGTCGKHVFILFDQEYEYEYLGSQGVEMTADTSDTSHHARAYKEMREF